VSQHVAALEREVGLPLVERGTRPVELTEAGHALSRHATGIFARLDGAEAELGDAGDCASGASRLCSPRSCRRPSRGSGACM
jgi:DNA-binding transcriptional LysR family regulator